MPNSSYVVAVIDDDDLIREALDTLLPAFDCKVELYASADAFWGAVKTTRADCLMIDVHLGPVSGIELGRLLPQVGVKLPVIYMTASDKDSIRRQAHDAGCVAFLRKPFRPEDFAQALHAARRRGPSV
jgi:FixJ family two-component response regulator